MQRERNNSKVNHIEIEEEELKETPSIGLEEPMKRNRINKVSIRKLIKRLNKSDTDLNHLSLSIIFFIIKKIYETNKRPKDRISRIIKAKISKLLVMVKAKTTTSLYDESQYFTKDQLLYGLLGKKRRQANKLKYKQRNERRYNLEQKATVQDSQLIAYGILSSIIDKAITISNRNNNHFDKPFQSLTPTYAMKNISFGILSPVSQLFTKAQHINQYRLSILNSPTSASASTQVQTITQSSINKQQYYPLTTTHSTSFHNHMMIFQNRNNTHISNNKPNCIQYSNKQFPYNTLPVSSPYPYSFGSMEYKSSEYYYNKLNKDLIEFTQTIDYFNDLLNEPKLKLIDLVKSIAYKSLQSLNIPISFEVFGSFVNGLSIESSDIDILIKYSSTQNYESTCIQLLQISFRSSGLFSLVFPIPSAKIPVIKLIAPLMSFISQEKMQFINSKHSSIDSISIDIIFANVYYSAHLPSLEIVHYIQNAIQLVPPIKCIMLFLKKFLIKKKLNSYYNGGLSSFSLFILLFSLIKYRNLYGNHNLINSAFILLLFLDFYSKFNFDMYGVNINLSYSYGFLGPNAINTPMIIDPITNLNIGSGTFKMDEIKKSFEDLIRELKGSNNNMLCNENVFQLILDKE